MKKLFLDVFLAGVAMLTLGYATVRADVDLHFENPFYIACTEYAHLAPETQHTVDVLLTVAVARGAASSEDRFRRDRGTLSCTRALQLLNGIMALDLSHEGLTDIGPLGGALGLTALILDGNDIESVAPLASLTRLDYLSAVGNRINDVSALSANETLRFLVLRKNVITSIEPLAGNPSLLRLDVRGNPVRDVVALSRGNPRLRIVGP